MIGALERIFARLQNVAGRGIVALVDDTGPIQVAQVQTNPIVLLDKVPLLYHFGFSASPPIGSEVMHSAINGDPMSTTVVATGHRASRPKNLQPGQTTLYDQAGSSITLTNDGNATIKCTGTLTIQATEVHVVGKITSTGDMTAATISLEHHVHSGVTTGSGDTGQPVP